MVHNMNSQSVQRWDDLMSQQADTENKIIEGSEKKGSVHWWKPVLLLGLLGAVLILTQVLDLKEQLGVVRFWIGNLGSYAPFAFALLYAVAVVAAVPGQVLTITAGALFGTVLGVVVVIFGATLGASVSFLIARYLARDTVAHWLSRNEKFRKLDRLTERCGATMVAITRLIPLFPFILLNYGFGLTKVPFWTYVFWSWLCMFPGTILYVAGSDALFTGIARGKIAWGIIVAMAVTAIILGFLIRFARGKLQNGDKASVVKGDL
jgi:uncharacterized membrane protein YdjX (TVP38/TMEM64 family)